MDNVYYVLLGPTVAQTQRLVQAVLPIRSPALEQVRVPIAQADRLLIR